MKKLSPVLERNAVRIISLAVLALIAGYALLSAHNHHQADGVMMMQLPAR